nr:proline-rich receptor-like protein kinase perk10 [Quercus suber]
MSFENNGRPSHLFRVVVIQGASREVSSSAIRWALHGLSLKPGDKLTLLAVIHQVKTPMGYGSRVDSSSMFGANERIIGREVAGKKNEYQNHRELAEISKLYEAKQVELDIEVATGPSPKEVALKAAVDIKATWVILDRMKRNNSIEQFRGPKTIRIDKLSAHVQHNNQVMYDELLPGFLDDEDLFSIELLPRCQTEADQEQEMTKRSSTGVSMKAWKAEEVCGFSTGTICENRQPDKGWKREFTYAELQAADRWISDESCLSVGGLGPTFRGQLENKLKIIVKQLKNTSQGQKSFDSEVHVLSRARHANVVMLLGSCVEESHMLLVYEYACNGSLDQYISRQSSTPLIWTDRIKIALGISRGLHYLHENNIIHGDIKPNNILLNHDFAPLVLGLQENTFKTDHFTKDKIDGTSAYSAPEHAESGKLSTKTDVYSFGVVLLELITGWRTKDKTLGKTPSQIEEVPAVSRPKIGNSHDFHQLLRIIQVIEQCLSKNPKKILSMDQVTLKYVRLVFMENCKVISKTFEVLASEMTIIV